MPALTEPGLAALVAAGCTCGSRELRFRALVPGVVRTFLGDPLGPPRWTFEGEDFVVAVYEVACGRCKARIFGRDDCPECRREGGLAQAIGRSPADDVPSKCTACGFEELSIKVLVPVEQAHDGKHARKPSPLADFGEAGHQPFFVECVSCKVVLWKRPPCHACGVA